MSGITKTYGQRVVLDDVSLTIRPGEKVAVIGDNGSGKSTLLRLIAGLEQPDAGELTVQAPGGLAHLAQVLDLPPEARVQDAIDHALAELRLLEKEMAAAEAQMAELSTEQLAAYGQMQAAYEARGGYDADVRVDIALHGLHLPGLDRSRRLQELSGGERSRLTLAATLASAPELLLLDEPTNDLDDSATSWLEDHLRRQTGTVVVVTHDRTFLERVAHTILEVDEDTRTVRRYGNGYAGYLAAKAAARARWKQEYQDWLTELDRQHRLSMTAAAQLATIGKRVALSNGGAGAARPRATSTGTSHKVRNANERLRRLREQPVPRPPDPLHFRTTVRTTGETATAQDVHVELTDVAVGDRLQVAELRITPGERLLITGANGAGKTTLLQVIAGELQPDHGTVTLPQAVGHLRQQVTVAHPGHTLLEAFAAGRRGLPPEHEHELLSLGLFRPTSLNTPVEKLSVGQRRRLELARLLVQPVDLLLLDEPTNHLSPVLVEEMQQALTDYPGTLIIVSHDRRLRSTFHGSRLELHEGQTRTTQTA